MAGRARPAPAGPVECLNRLILFGERRLRRASMRPGALTSGAELSGVRQRGPVGRLSSLPGRRTSGSGWSRRPPRRRLLHSFSRGLMGARRPAWNAVSSERPRSNERRPCAKANGGPAVRVVLRGPGVRRDPGRAGDVQGWRHGDEGIHRVRRRGLRQAARDHPRARVVGHHEARARRGDQVRPAGLHGVHRRHVRRREDRGQSQGRGRALGRGHEGSASDAVPLRRGARDARETPDGGSEPHRRRRLLLRGRGRAQHGARRSRPRGRGHVPREPGSQYAGARRRERSRPSSWC